MELIQQVANLELSKRLKELGVEQNSVWFWKSIMTIGEQAILVKKRGKERQGEMSSTFYYSAFTCAELGEMLPKKIKKYGLKYRVKTFALMITFEKKNGWKISYNNKIGELVCNVSRDFSEANCRAKMLIYLKQNKLI